MRIIIDNCDRYVLGGRFNLYGVMHATAFHIVMMYVESYYPGSHVITVPIWFVGLMLARIYKIVVKGMWMGFSCIFPVTFLPAITIAVFHLTGFSDITKAAHLLDVTSVAIPIYMMLIRYANLNNSELIGIKTDKRPYVSYQRHQGNRIPIPLYESMAGLMILFMQLVNQPCLARTPDGFNYLMTMLAWGATRFTLEFYKDDQANQSIRKYGLNHEQQWVLVAMILTASQFTVINWLV